MEKELQELFQKIRQATEASITQGVQMALESFSVKLGNILSTSGGEVLKLLKKAKEEDRALQDVKEGNA